MPTYFCDAGDCIYYDNRRDCCTNADAAGDCDECAVYKSCLETAEYRKEFWKRMKGNKTGGYFRERDLGKRFEEDGVVFFSRSNSNGGLDPGAGCTEESTGLAFTYRLLSDVRRKLIQLKQTDSEVTPPLMQLPILPEDER